MEKLKQILIKVFYPLLYLTLFSIPFQIRKVILPAFKNGYFQETLSMSFYLTDILIILCVIGGFFLFWKEIKQYCATRLCSFKNPLCWIFLFLLWQIATLFRANDLAVGIFRISKIIEMFLFGCVLYFSCSRDVVNCTSRTDKILLAISLSGVFQSVWAILQFSCQHSLGLSIFQESILSPAISGVAKVVIGGQKYIRAYGGLPHSNLLAGFLLLSIICTVVMLFRQAKQGDQSKLTLFMCNRYTKLTLVLLFVQIIGFILAGSFSAFFGLLLGILIIITLFMCNRYTKLTLFMCISVVFMIFLSILFLRFSDLTKNKTSIVQRSQQYKETLKILGKNDNIILGVGIGNYVNGLDNLEFEWQKQPTHNVFMLVLAENGIIGVVIFIIVLVLFFKGNLGALSVLPILMLDHYLYTIQQGMLTFVAIIIIAVILNGILKNEETNFEERKKTGISKLTLFMWNRYT